MKDISRLFIVDDHQMFIDGIKALLRNSKDFEVVGDALDGQTAFDFIKCNNIDIVITDISMPGMSGIELTQLLKDKVCDDCSSYIQKVQIDSITKIKQIITCPDTWEFRRITKAKLILKK